MWERFFRSLICYREQMICKISVFKDLHTFNAVNFALECDIENHTNRGIISKIRLSFFAWSDFLRSSKKFSEIRKNLWQQKTFIDIGCGRGEKSPAFADAKGGEHIGQLL